MKRVSFEVAKALKEAGYPQGVLPKILKEKSFPMYYNGDFVPNYVYFYAYYITTFDTNLCVACPTYIEVWLWLWREKGMILSIEYVRATETEFESWTTLNQEHLPKVPTSNGDPEEAIIAAIESLCDNNLIK